MDGVYTSEHRRIFLLTTNETRINENLLSRPSRLRYVKEFGNLEQSVVIEYLKDNLKDSECVDCVVDFVDTLQISTIDILKTIVEDINIHGFDTFMQNKDIFNVKTANYHYSVYYTGFSNIEEARALGYNDLEKFVKDIKTTETNQRPYEYQYQDHDAYVKAYEEWEKKRYQTRSISTRYLDSSKSVKVLKIGDSFGYYNSERVINIDLSKKIVVTVDSDDEVYYYFIKDMNTKPSLYSSSTETYVNGYYPM